MNLIKPRMHSAAEPQPKMESRGLRMEREQVKQVQKNSRKAAKTLSDSSTEDLAWGYDDQWGSIFVFVFHGMMRGFTKKALSTVIRRYPPLWVSEQPSTQRGFGLDAPGSTD
jgi:hypothetical protein